MLVSKRTEVTPSDKEFSVSNVSLVEGDVEKVVELGDVKNLVAFQRGTCMAKVVTVDDAEEVTGGRKKQDLLVGDVSGAVRLTLWESEIGKVEEGMCYKFSGVVVREFKGKKFLSTAKENCSILKIYDIGCVEEGDEESEGVSNLFDHHRPVEVNMPACYIALLHDFGFFVVFL